MKTRKTLIHPHDTAADERTETLRKCVRSEETCPKGASEAYCGTSEKPLGQRFAGDDVFYQGFPWKIVLASMAILGGAQGVILNTSGITLAAIVRDLGFRAGDLTVFYTILYLVAALCVPFTSRAFFAAAHPRAVTALLGTLFALPFAGMSACSQLWHWYAAAAVCGVGYSCMMVSVMTVLNSWFASRKGLVIGVAMSAPGLLGALLAPPYAACVEAFGWRASVAAAGALAFALIVLCGASMFVPSPQLAGRAPWGNAAHDSCTGDEKPHRVPPFVFPLCLITFASLNALFQFYLQLPLLAKTLGYSLASGAVLTSCSMIGNIGGKVLLGAAIDRLGAFRSGTLLALSLLTAFAVFQFLPGVFPALCAASVLFGGSFATGGVLLPQTCLAIWGHADYRPRLSRLTAFNMFAAAFSGSVFPYLYDFTGGWAAALLLCMSICAAAAATFAFFARTAKKWA